MKITKLMKYALPALAALIILTGCPVVHKIPGPKPEVPVVPVVPPNPITGITVTRGALAVNEGQVISLNVDQEITITVKLRPSGVQDAVVTWTQSSADVDVIPSESGLSAVVKGRTAGGSLSITISASNADTDEPITRTFIVSVNTGPVIPSNPVTDIIITKNGEAVGEVLNIDVNEEINLDVALSPDGVQGAVVTWTESSADVGVLPSEDGLYAVVKGKTEGGSLAITVSAANADNDEPVTRNFIVSVNIGPDEPAEPDDPRKREFRAMWVSTIGNLDFARAASETAFRTNFAAVLDTCEAWNMNAVIFQVSPLSDAYWQSSHRPWSQYILTGGQQGTGPAWDPLAIMVEETHKRGLEFHAWFNPYRVTNTAYEDTTVSGKTAAELDAMTNADAVNALLGAFRANNTFSADNWAVLNPDKVYRYLKDGSDQSRKLFLDAGYPEVRQHVVDTITEVIQNYDVDAIHFDDYFYPYGSGWGTNPAVPSLNHLDALTFTLHGTPNGYGSTQAERERWWRDNNTKLITAVQAAIRAENTARGKAVQLGVSPFGIWDHKYYQPDLGSNTPSGSNRTYSGGVYADTRKWVVDGLVDYMCPQLYWYIGLAAADYAVLAPWWANVHALNENVHLYIGHNNANQTGSSEGTGWSNSDAILDQLRLNRTLPLIKGSAFFRYGRLRSPINVIMTTSNTKVKAFWNEYKTVVPAKTWLKNTAPTAPLSARRSGNTITWTDTALNDARYYVVYRTFAEDGSPAVSVITQPENIIGRVGRVNNQTAFSFIDTDDLEYDDYVYLITAFNDAHIESKICVAVKQ